MKVPEAIVEILRCPGHPDRHLRRRGGAFFCEVDGKTLRFPIIEGTPILINEDNSIFSIADFKTGRPTTMNLNPDARKRQPFTDALKSILSTVTPSKSRYVSDFDAKAAIDQILSAVPSAKILVVGAGDARFVVMNEATLVYTDVALAPDTHIVADAHDLPFADDSFDAVIAVAVLEHVADPYRCVMEFQRVSKSAGLVYAVTPFMQQVHLGAYDFTRFTHIGHRRLFRWYDEIVSGVANGPGMALTWSFEYFLTGFSESPILRTLLQTAARFVAWPFLLFDMKMSRKRGAFDSASAYYFFGRLRDTPINDRDIIRSYKGLHGLTRND
jgi:SAM-dependent methyltransferase